VHEEISSLAPVWAELSGMRVARAVPAEVEARATVALADQSFLPRFGVKGPGAEAWLRERGVEAAGTNQWAPLAGEGLVARLGLSEFLVVDSPAGDVAGRLAREPLPRPGVTPVPRQDAALLLAGPRLQSLLVQVCSFDFRTPQPHSRSLVMTSMAGVSVLAIPGTLEEKPLLRLWCDGTYGPYLWRTLLAVARDLGGGAAGLGSLYPGWFGK
jgi:sarcosine oxidase subunit gamma